MRTGIKLVDYKHVKCCIGMTCVHSELAKKLNQDLPVISVDDIKAKIEENSSNGVIPIQQCFDIIDSFMDDYFDYEKWDKVFCRK